MLLLATGLPFLTRLFQYVSDNDRCALAHSCKSLHRSSRDVDHILRTHRFITEHYELLTQSSVDEPFTALSLLRWRVVILSEYHNCRRHRLLNSQLVGLLWRWDTSELMVEGPSDVQVALADLRIRQQRRNWDIDTAFITPFYHLKVMDCAVCLAYIECFSDGRCDFAAFLQTYLAHKGNAARHANELVPQPLLCTRAVQELCQGAQGATDPLTQRRHQLALATLLSHEAKLACLYLDKVLDQYAPLRDLNLTRHILHSLASGKTPIVVCGHAHTVSDQVQQLSKQKIFHCLSFKPRSTPQSRGAATADANAAMLDMCDAIDSQTDHWSVVTTLMRMMAQGATPQQVHAYLASDDAIRTSLRLKILQLRHINPDQQQNEDLPFWHSLCIAYYIAAIQHLEKQIKSL